MPAFSWRNMHTEYVICCLPSFLGFVCVSGVREMHKKTVVPRYWEVDFS